jgi:Spy/CpxP family protein refolding chaperone
MKRKLSLLIVVLAASGALSNSQAPTTDPVATLRKIKATNAELIDRQTKTLKLLDELQKDSQQIKTLGKRA